MKVINNEHGEIQNEDEDISRDVIEEQEDRAEQITELCTKVFSSETLCSTNKTSRAENIICDTSETNSNVILHLTPAPVVVTPTPTTVNQSSELSGSGKKTQTKMTKNNVSNCSSTVKRELKNSKSVAASNSKSKSSKVSIAGKVVDMKSDKAQYLKLTFDQIQELALKQKSTNSDAAIEDNKSSKCPMHHDEKSKTSVLSDSKNYNTLPRQKRSKKDNSHSPDIVIEAEANEKSGQTEARVGKSSKPVARSKSFNVKSTAEKKNPRNPSETQEARRVTKKSDFKSAAKGGLYAPTQSWLSYLNDRKPGKDVCDANGVDVKQRSKSVSRSRDREDRSVSPRY